MVFSWILTHGFRQKGFVQEIWPFYDRGRLLSIENTPAVLGNNVIWLSPAII